MVRGGSGAKTPPLAVRPGEGVLPGQQLRVLCVETELEKRKKEKVRLSLSVSLVKGDRVGTRLIGLQGAGHVVHVCLKPEGWYEGANVEESSVEPRVMKFCGKCCRWVCKYDGRLLVQCARIPWWLVAKFK